MNECVFSIPQPPRCARGLDKKMQFEMQLELHKRLWTTNELTAGCIAHGCHRKAKTNANLVQPRIAGVVHLLPVGPALLLPVVRLLQLLLQPHRLPRLQQGLPEGLPEVHTQGCMIGYIHLQGR